MKIFCRFLICFEIIVDRIVFQFICLKTLREILSLNKGFKISLMYFEQMYFIAHFINKNSQVCLSKLNKTNL